MRKFLDAIKLNEAVGSPIANSTVGDNLKAQQPDPSQNGSPAVGGEAPAGNSAPATPVRPQGSIPPVGDQTDQENQGQPEDELHESVSQAYREFMAESDDEEIEEACHDLITSREKALERSAAARRAKSYSNQNKEKKQEPKN